MSGDRSLFERLAESVGPMAHLPNNGASYHTGEQIVTHLNRVLGPQAWSFHVLDMGIEEDSDECWVFAQLTAVIDGVTVVKQDYGSQAMKRVRSTGKWMSKGKDRKAAATDALKRCARLLGVGLDAWANESAPSWDPDQDALPKEEPPFRYADVKARYEAAAEYERLVKVAVATGYQHAARAQAKHAKDLSDAELEGSIRVLRKWEMSQRPDGVTA